jgi:hypothetical protein
MNAWRGCVAEIEGVYFAMHKVIAASDVNRRYMFFNNVTSPNHTRLGRMGFLAGMHVVVV